MAAPIRISKILLGLIKASPQCRIGRRYASAAPQESRTWQLHSAVCLQRYPRLTAPMNDIEQRFQEHLNKVEYRRSLRSNYELDLTKEKELFEKMKIMTEDEKKKLIAEQDLLTMKEQEEDWQKEFEEFKLTDRLTGKKYPDEGVSMLLKQKFTPQPFAFFFKATYLSGDVQETGEMGDWKWVTIDSLHEYVGTGSYLKHISQFLVDS
ncbi:RM46-like protein [Mya arenaria]|uniref:RM46-like protein n=1 Tax=Mya arenaria TaxID=6604 RepID=A0ABY7DSW1_MYAAR|nr:RM46-like protein [Mya arenaria]